MAENIKPDAPTDKKHLSKTPVLDDKNLHDTVEKSVISKNSRSFAEQEQRRASHNALPTEVPGESFECPPSESPEVVKHDECNKTGEAAVAATRANPSQNRLVSSSAEEKTLSNDTLALKTVSPAEKDLESAETSANYSLVVDEKLDFRSEACAPSAFLSPKSNSSEGQSAEMSTMLLAQKCGENTPACGSISCLTGKEYPIAFERSSELAVNSGVEVSDDNDRDDTDSALTDTDPADHDAVTNRTDPPTNFAECTDCDTNEATSTDTGIGADSHQADCSDADCTDTDEIPVDTVGLSSSHEHPLSNKEKEDQTDTGKSLIDQTDTDKSRTDQSDTGKSLTDQNDTGTNLIKTDTGTSCTEQTDTVTSLTGQNGTSTSLTDQTDTGTRRTYQTDTGTNLAEGDTGINKNQTNGTHNGTKHAHCTGPSLRRTDRAGSETNLLNLTVKEISLTKISFINTVVAEIKLADGANADTNRRNRPPTEVNPPERNATDSASANRCQTDGTSGTGGEDFRKNGAQRNNTGRNQIDEADVQAHQLDDTDAGEIITTVPGHGTNGTNDGDARNASRLAIMNTGTNQADDTDTLATGSVANTRLEDSTVTDTDISDCRAMDTNNIDHRVTHRSDAGSNRMGKADGGRNRTGLIETDSRPKTDTHIDTNLGDFFSIGTNITDHSDAGSRPKDLSDAGTHRANSTGMGSRLAEQTDVNRTDNADIATDHTDAFEPAIDTMVTPPYVSDNTAAGTMLTDLTNETGHIQTSKNHNDHIGSSTVKSECSETGCNITDRTDADKNIKDNTEGTVPDPSLGDRTETDSSLTDRYDSSDADENPTLGSTADHSHTQFSGTPDIQEAQEDGLFTGANQTECTVTDSTVTADTNAVGSPADHIHTDFSDAPDIQETHSGVADANQTDCTDSDSSLTADTDGDHVDSTDNNTKETIASGQTLQTSDTPDNDTKETIATGQTLQTSDTPDEDTKETIATGQTLQTSDTPDKDIKETIATGQTLQTSDTPDNDTNPTEGNGICTIEIHENCTTDHPRNTSNSDQNTVKPTHTTFQAHLTDANTDSRRCQEVQPCPMSQDSNESLPTTSVVKNSGAQSSVAACPGRRQNSRHSSVPAGTDLESDTSDSRAASPENTTDPTNAAAPAHLTDATTETRRCQEVQPCPQSRGSDENLPTASSLVNSGTQSSEGACPVRRPNARRLVPASRDHVPGANIEADHEQLQRPLFGQTQRCSPHQRRVPVCQDDPLLTGQARISPHITISGSEDHRSANHATPVRRSNLRHRGILPAHGGGNNVILIGEGADLSAIVPGLTGHWSMPSDQVLAILIRHFGWGAAEGEAYQRQCLNCDHCPVDTIFFSCHHMLLCQACAREVRYCRRCDAARPFAVFDPHHLAPT